MTIKNLDRVDNSMEDVKDEFKAAIEKNDNEAYAKAMTKMANVIQTNILNEVTPAVQTEIASNLNNQAVLNSRGLHALTNEERSYYNEVIASGEAFAGVEKLIPATVIDRVFEELVRNRPLLQAIDFINVTGLTEWIMKKGEIPAAWWGKLCDDIKQVIDEGFEKVQLNLYKLSAYIPVCKAMLDLGPEWLDRYVRTVLMESMYIALEQAVISGTGKEQPIGMMKNLDGAVVGGIYPDKTAVALNDLSPKTLGKEIMAPLTNNGKRNVANVIMVVNPMDYWARIFPAITFQNANGEYVQNTAIPIQFIQSTEVPNGKSVTGMAKDYFLGVGSTQKIEFSDEVKFIEDERVYIGKQYANGRPKDNKSFLVFDISKLGEKASTPTA
ncbi:phage major capsid protein [Bacillus cereus]|uniref:phage major capsid protein n=1 Tax=Bacillus cereus group TaxID=86661 RepID=UPI0010BE984D|nr:MULTISPECIES: phage major capsid protein [Bacillus cereus group]MDR5047291.1 phage major capsid protein [Bacillus thuringiensis]MEB8859261.1 phage major capsid protein [Bacillus cereus]MEB9420422.1 phage major capsid protein [Bacillus cereus]MEC2469179.1 phage major capsid protein [Bacillus cereus]MRC82002.1 phage major capsid protein [Bacillus thuringiensis]